MRTRRQWLRVLAEPVRVEESISFGVPRSAAEVWEFMWDPESLLVLEPGTTQALTLPGTPAHHVGEVQVSVHGTGPTRRLTALEVLAMEPGRTAVTRTLTDSLEAGARLDVEPTGEAACRLTQSFHVEVPAGADVAYVEIHRASLRQGLEELRERVLQHHGAQPDN